MKRILIIDDNAATRKKFSRLPKNYEHFFDVLTCKTGREAAKVISKLTINLVIIGLRMPEMQGFKLLTHLNKNYPKIKIIILADIGSPKPIAQIKTLRPSMYFEAPVDMGLLTERIFTELQIGYGGQVLGISLSSFLQMLEMEETTCTLKITKNGKIGYLYLINGTLIAAQAGALKGEEAALKIIGWGKSVIKIDYTPRPKQREIDKPLMNLLLEMRRIQDEKKIEIKQQRKHPRISCLVPVDYDINEGSYNSLIRNISLGGAFIETQEAVGIGHRILLSLSSPKLQKYCNIMGEVVRRDPKGIGVRFGELSQHQGDTIESLIEQV